MISSHSQELKAALMDLGEAFFCKDNKANDMRTMGY